MAKSRSKEIVDKEIVELPISALRPHPRQGELYHPRSAQEIEELAVLMKDGLTEEVEITPDKVIIAGHGRVAAARTLRWKTIRCWVRRDLAEAGEEAVERRVIES